AIEQGLVGVGIVTTHPLHQVVLPHHPRSGGFLSVFSGLRGNSRGVWSALVGRRAPARLVLHARQVRQRRPGCKNIMTIGQRGKQFAAVPASQRYQTQTARTDTGPSTNKTVGTPRGRRRVRSARAALPAA